MMKRVLSVVFAAAILVGLLAVFPVAANATSGMTVSQECVDRIKKIEGFHAIPYWDYSQWTVGFGSTCPTDKLEKYKAEGIPMEEANRLMMEQLAKFEEGVNSFADENGLKLTQGQFDALVSMTYNLGTGVIQNSGNRVNQAILQGATGNDLIFAFSVYCAAGGEFLPGLMRRRLVEANMYLNGRYDDYAPENYCYVLYNANGGTRDVIAQGYDCNLAAQPMSVPSYSGYTFVGWYTAANGGTKITSLDESTAGMTLYAHWAKGDSTPETDKNVEVTVTEEAVNVRIGPGMDYAICGGVFRNEKIKITGVTVVDGVRWGKFSKGWICLRYTNYALLTGDHDESADEGSQAEQIELPIMATVLSDSGVVVYNGPHSTYPQLKTLKKGTLIEITEIYTLFDVMWGKCADGWVQINLRLQLHDQQKLAHSFQVTINYQYYLNVRSGPGTSYSLVTTLANGTQVEIVAVEYVGDVPWGRCHLGWIHLGYTTFNADLLEVYSNHIYGQWYTAVEATCVSDGIERRDCSYCGQSEERTISKGSHSYGDWYVSEEGTCETPSQERRDCKNCDHFETRQNALGGHHFGDWYVTEEGDCQTPSKERRDCQYCDSYETRETENAAHKFDEWFTYQESTCTIAGEQWRLCMVCGYVESRALELAEHSYGQWYETVTPSAETEGEERRDCQHCDAYETRVLEKTEHIYGEWYVVQEPGCETEGLEQRDCQHCTEVLTRVIAATGHNMDQWYDLSAPTCTEKGVQCRVCLNCNLLENREVDALGHDYDEWIPLTETTCTQDGEQCRVCKTCAYMDVQSIAAEGHNFSNWITVSKATCEADGEQCRACVKCSFVEFKTIPALEHSFGAWVVVTEAACGQPGLERRDCDLCDHYETRELMASDHSFGDWYVYQPSNCGVDGEERRDCAKCGYVDSRVITAEPHAFGQWYTVSAGLERRDCANCGGYETRVTQVPDQTVTKVYGIVEEYYVQVRSGAGTGYASVGKLYYGDRVEILEQQTVSGSVWGRIGDDRWVCVTDCLELETVEETVTSKPVVYATVTVTLLNIRQAPNTNNVAVGYLLQGERVEILEQKTVSGAEWGRIESGWICLTDNARLETVFETENTAAQVVIRVMGTITYDGLNVRSGCGTSYSKVGTLAYGTCVEILEIGLSGSQVWGRVETGWIRVDGYVTLEMIRQELIDGHDYGQWYQVTAASCTTDGEERRDCSLCGESQTRTIPAFGHRYSNWTVVEEPTCVQQGVEAHICQNCMHSEIRSLPMGDHSYSNWYTTKPATTTEAGQERRDCQHCDVYETRETEMLQGDVTKTYGVLTGYSHVNIRAGAGSGFELLGKLEYGDVVEILEQQTDSSGRTWGRISENGWVCITGYLTLKTVTEPAGGPTTTTVTKTYGTVTASALNIRGGAGASFDLLGVLYQGARVEILEKQTDSSGRTWGRISENGWICLPGYVNQETVTEELSSDLLTVTLKVNTSRLKIYSETSTDSTNVGYLIFAAKVEVLELKVVDGQMWARILQGWIMGDDLV